MGKHDPESVAINKFIELFQPNQKKA
jgi:hypothetical protein